MALLAVCAAAYAEPRVAIIVNSDNTQTLTDDDIRNIYADKIITWRNGTRIDVYNLPIASPARDIFSKRVLGMTAQDAAIAESNRNITNSVRNPQKMKRERLLVSIVAKRPSAIGYCTEIAALSKSGIRIVAVLE